jgi:hypothetical protein
MRLSRLLFAAPLVAAVLVLGSSGARADDIADFLKPENWEGRTDLWTIKDGTIVGETKEDPKYNNFLVSKKKYSDFELSFKVQLRDGTGNSGVQIRSELVDPKKYVVAGPQADIGAQYWGSLYGEKVGGMMKASPSDFVKKSVKPGDFNDYHIVVKGNHVTIKVNGQTTVDEDFAMLPNKKPMPGAGVIAFQIHAGFPKMRVEYRDIKFTDLSKK